MNHYHHLGNSLKKFRTTITRDAATETQKTKIQQEARKM